MSLDLEALEAAFGTDAISLAGDVFEVDGGPRLHLEDLTKAQRAIYDEKTAETDAMTAEFEVKEIANRVRVIATENADHVKVGGWNAKVERAERVNRGEPTEADLRILGAEAAIRGRTVEEQAQIILAKAELLGELNGIVEGFEDVLVNKAREGHAALVRSFVADANQTLQGQTRDTIGAWIAETSGRLQEALSGA